MRSDLADTSAAPSGAIPTSAGLELKIFGPALERLRVEFDYSGQITSHDLRQNGDFWEIAVPELPQRVLYRLVGRHRGREYLIFDPYADGIVDHPWNQRGDEAGWCRKISHDFDWGDDQHPNHPWERTLVYEAHVRGFTMNAGTVSAPGTFRALREKLRYIADLGITTLELLPIFHFEECDNPRYNPDTGEPLLNYWGYQPLSFFALKGSYASSLDPQTAADEFRALVREAHQLNLEVILDVVFNHTGETDSVDRLPGWLYLSPETFYQCNEAGLVNATGCGNTLNVNNPFVCELALSSLRHWVEHFHVDGFRYDLGGAFYRDERGHPLFRSEFVDRIFSDSVLQHRKHIFEPWDASGHNVSEHLPSEAKRWDDDLRDALRRFVNSHEQNCGQLAYLLTQPRNDCINFLTAHDGFTLRDCLSFAEKRNWANGEGNCDGVDFNHSSNWGHDGDPAPGDVEKMRLRQAKNLLALLLLAPGTPMILSGDECFNTQFGNNNAYCVDSPVSWFDWENPLRYGALLQFTRQMIRLRGVLQEETSLAWEAASSEDRVLRLRTSHGLHVTANLGDHPVPRHLGEDTYSVLSTAAADGEEFVRSLVRPDSVPAYCVEICQTNS